MIQRFPFAPGGTSYSALASFVLYLEPDRDVTDEQIRVFVDGSPVGLLRPGESLRFAQPVADIRVEPLDPTLSGVVMLGTSQFSSSRGLVDSLGGAGDSAWRRVADGLELVGALLYTPAAGAFAAVGLRAPASRGLVIRSAVIGASAATRIRTVFASGTASAPGASFDLVNKDAGAAAADTVTLWGADSATFAPPAVAGVSGFVGPIRHHFSGTGSTISALGSPPLLLGPGRAVLWVAEAAGAALTCNIDAHVLRI